MPNENPEVSVFEKTCQNYLIQIFSNLQHLSADRLGVSLRDNEIRVDLLDRTYTVSKDGIKNQSGERPSFDVCIILLKYLLTDRGNYSQDKNWCSYRDLKDSNPLIHYFTTNVENAFIREFSGDIDRLKKSCDLLGGKAAQEQFSRDISIQFSVLPRVPVLLLFNDKDEEFTATCSVLFERRAENYLDAECLAMAGIILFEFLLKTVAS
jgi:hypothetical protein